MQRRNGQTYLIAKGTCKICEDDEIPLSDLAEHDGMCWGCWCDWCRTDPKYLQGQAEYRIEER